MAGKIKRGEVWLVNLDPALHREIHKKRPALIVSDNEIHSKTFHVIIIPISSIVPQEPGPEMVIIGKKEGVDKSSVVLPIFIRSIDQKRLVKKIGKISNARLSEVEGAVKLVLGIQK